MFDELSVVAPRFIHVTSTHDTPDSPSGLLAAVRAGDRAVRAGELAKAHAVLAWLDAHPADSIHTAVGQGPGTGGALHGERALLLGGPGTPMIAEPVLRARR